MTNPLLSRPAAYHGPQIERTGASYAEDLAAHYNRLSNRDDVEWAVNDGQVYIRDKLHLTARRTRELDTKTEADRQKWKRAQARSE